MANEDEKREEVKSKLDKALEKRKETESETPEEEENKPTLWTPFAKKIYADIELYFSKLDNQTPTRQIAFKFRSDIEDKVEDGKEK